MLGWLRLLTVLVRRAVSYTLSSVNNNEEHRRRHSYSGDKEPRSHLSGGRADLYTSVITPVHSDSVPYATVYGCIRSTDTDDVTAASICGNSAGVGSLPRYYAAPGVREQ